MTIAVSHCPHCDGYIKLQTKQSRAHHVYGFPTVKRRRSCPRCDFKISTIELPLEIGNEVFAED
jgi:transcriptional regulator NrdR family protein